MLRGDVVGDGVVPVPVPVLSHPFLGLRSGESACMQQQVTAEVPSILYKRPAFIRSVGV